MPCVTFYRKASDRIADASDMSEQKFFDNQHTSEHD
jgi:hypothetical protein